MRYFIGKDGKQLGPFDAKQVRERLNAGLIAYEDLVWREGMAAWAPVSTEFPPIDVPPLPTPTGAASANPFLAAAGETPAGRQLVLAGRRQRLGAVILDGLAMLLVSLPGLFWLIPNFENFSQNSGNPTEILAQIAAPLLLLMLPLLALLVYQTWLLSVRGQTIGKRILGIRIVRMNGDNPGFMHAVMLRSFVMQLLGAIPFVGGIIGIVDPLLIFRADRRCLHDLLADTQVVEA
ncbi:MAG: hypothetical protein RLZZ50_482 [Verrucomicrobiota bacterium]